MIVLSVAFASFMVRLNNYTVNVSLPTIAEYFRIGTGEASRIVMSYLLVITSTLLIFGKLGDRLGLKKIFIAGYIVFVTGSLMCGLSSSINMLIGSRAIQGIGGSMLLATSFATISRFLPQDRRGWAFGITSTASALGVATGAPFGGFITGYLSWHWIFFINVPVGAAAIFIAGRKIPSASSSKERATTETGIPEKEAFDFIGALLSLLGLSLLLYGFNTAKQFGWNSIQFTSCFAGSFVFLFLFVLRQRKYKAPLLDLSLFKNPAFTLALCATFMAYIFVTGNAFIMPFYLKMTKGLNSQQIGMVLFVYSLIYIIMSSHAGRLSDRVSPVTLCSVAMLSAGINTFIFAYTLQFSGLLFVLIFLLWMAFSFVFFFSPNNNRVMRCAPPDRHGIASGTFNTISNLGMVFGVAIFEAVFSFYSGGIPAKTIDSESASIQGSLQHGFQAVYLLGGAVCIGALVFSLLAKSKRIPQKFSD